MKNNLITGNNLRHKLSTKFPPLHYFRGKRVREKVEETYLSADQIIFDLIQRGEPGLIGRFGASEARTLGCYLDIFKGHSVIDPISTLFSLVSYQKRLKQLSSGAGVYPPTRETGKIFTHEYLHSIEISDILACWGEAFTSVEDLALKLSGAQTVHHHATSPWVEPYIQSSVNKKAWSFALEGKTVAVVSGFSETFASQHKRISQVFKNVEYPKFEPIFIKAPLTQGGLDDGKSWKWHLEKTKEFILKKEFDVLLVSAGGYSFPIAAYAKELGNIGIHCGGELQLFFGVLGKRWESSEKITKYRNEYWVRPSELERPTNWREIEDGCYW